MSEDKIVEMSADEIKEEIVNELQIQEPEVVQVDPNELMKQISIDLKEEDKQEIKQRGRKKKNVVAEDVHISEDLFQEFSSFLKNKAEIVEEQKSKIIIPTGLDLLDAILGGGFVVGALEMIVGQPGSGKSMLAMQVLAQGQRQYKNQMLAGFLDSEEATTPIRLANLGANYKQTKLLQDVTVEKVFKFLEGICLFKDLKEMIDIPSIVVWDSVANTLTQKEREAEDLNSVIGYKARVLSILVPKYVAKCAKYNVCLIAVNQMRDVINIGQFAPAKDLKFMSQSKDIPGGMALKYNAFHLLEMKVGQILTQDKYGFDGVKTKIKAVKNKLFQPNIEIELMGSFNTGFSNFWTNFQFLVDNKRFTTGAWNYLIDMPEKKMRTKEIEDEYNSDPVFKAKFDEVAKETIKTEILDKYSYNNIEIENEVSVSNQ